MRHPTEALLPTSEVAAFVRCMLSSWDIQKDAFPVSSAPHPTKIQAPIRSQWRQGSLCVSRVKVGLDTLFVQKNYRLPGIHLLCGEELTAGRGVGPRERVTMGLKELWVILRT